MIEQSININVTSPGIPVSIYTKQYDSNSREIVATLWDGSAPYAMPSGASAMLRYRKPDGTSGLYDTDSHGNAITIADNVVTIPIDDQVMTAAGKVMAEVDIYGTNNMRIATFDFWVYVSQTVCEDSAITSSDYYNVLTQQIANALAAEAAAATSATDASDSATLAQSWAAGGTDTRTGEDTDNAHYWAQQAEAATTGYVKYNSKQTLTDEDKQQARENIGATGPLLYNNAGAHNAIYRGENLGSEVSSAQWAEIAAGTFDEMYIGDYWTIGGVTYRIAAFDYYLRSGDTDLTTHHVTVVPDNSLYSHVMNDANITTGGYINSKMYTVGLGQAKTTINAAFGASHILTHRLFLCNATTGDYESGRSWYDSTAELMTEQNVYGGKILGDAMQAGSYSFRYEVDKSQYPLFSFRPDMISNRQWFWLRDVASAANFAYVTGDGFAGGDFASRAFGVRPAFSIS